MHLRKKEKGKGEQTEASKVGKRKKTSPCQGRRQRQENQRERQVGWQRPGAGKRSDRTGDTKDQKARQGKLNTEGAASCQHMKWGLASQCFYFSQQAPGNHLAPGWTLQRTQHSAATGYYTCKSSYEGSQKIQRMWCYQISSYWNCINSNRELFKKINV